MKLVVKLCKAKPNTPCKIETDCLKGLICTAMSDLEASDDVCKVPPLGPCEIPVGAKKNPCRPGYACVETNGTNKCCKLNYWSYSLNINYY